jgi:hypothetical protein
MRNPPETRCGSSEVYRLGGSAGMWQRSEHAFQIPRAEVAHPAAEAYVERDSLDMAYHVFRLAQEEGGAHAGASPARGK